LLLATKTATVFVISGTMVVIVRIDRDAYDGMLSNEEEVRDEVLRRLDGDEPDPDDGGDDGTAQPPPSPRITRPTK
jgi:hypothetical protein